MQFDSIIIMCRLVDDIYRMISFLSFNDDDLTNDIHRLSNSLLKLPIVILLME